MMDQARPIGTTIVAVRREGRVAMAGDGQVTVGDVVLKRTARKLRRIYRDQVLAGFAGTIADALALFDKFEGYLQKHEGQLRRAAVDFAKEWRSDKELRHLEAWLIVADTQQMLVLSGDGEVIDPDDDVVAIGSGGGYALAAARALLEHSQLNAREIATRSMEIAADLCIYTNRNIVLLELPPSEGDS